MKEITEEEFQDRMGALARAGRIFPDVLNVTERFRLYQEVFAERESEIFISTQFYGNKTRTQMDRYERPKCPECEADMQFRPVPENPEGVKVQLVCTKCDTVLNDTHDLKWWMQNLKVKNGSKSVS